MTYYNDPVITDWQKQLIMGTILGGSSIVKPVGGRNCYLFMRSTNQPWIRYKAEELKSMASTHPFTQDANTLRWHSNCFPVFNELRNLFYVKSKKTVSIEILDPLRDIALAIWFGDCGKVKDDCVILNTHKFGKDGTNLIVNYFKLLGIDCEMLKERNNYRLLMNKTGSQKFLVIVSQCLPELTLKSIMAGAA